MPATRALVGSRKWSRPRSTERCDSARRAAVGSSRMARTVDSKDTERCSSGVRTRVKTVSLEHRTSWRICVAPQEKRATATGGGALVSHER